MSRETCHCAAAAVAAAAVTVRTLTVTIASQILVCKHYADARFHISLSKRVRVLVFSCDSAFCSVDVCVCVLFHEITLVFRTNECNFGKEETCMDATVATTVPLAHKYMFIYIFYTEF